MQPVRAFRGQWLRKDPVHLALDLERQREIRCRQRGAAELAEYRRLQAAERGKAGKGESRKAD